MSGVNAAQSLLSETTSVHTYRAYGLTIQSDLPLPELIAMPAAPAAITIRRGRITPAPGVVHGEERCVWATADETCLFWADAGTILIRYGTEMIVEPLPHVDERVLRLYLLGPALGVLLQQRGLLVLHASAVAIGESAVAFMGESGWGKSTTAAALHRHGHAIVADDVTALHPCALERPLVYPAIPRLKLDATPAEALGYPVEALARFDVDDERLAYHVNDRFPQAPLPLSRVYVLAEGPEVTIERCRPQDAFIELVRHSYALRVIGDRGASTAHFHLCTHVVDSVPVYRLKRPSSLAVLPDLVRCVEAHAVGR
jgi:hypothetical protein